MRIALALAVFALALPAHAQLMEVPFPPEPSALPLATSMPPVTDGASPADVAARAEFRRGLELAGRGRTAEAAELFAHAYASTHRLEALRNAALLDRVLGRNARAATEFARYR